MFSYIIKIFLKLEKYYYFYKKKSKNRKKTEERSKKIARKEIVIKTYKKIAPEICPEI